MDEELLKLRTLVMNHLTLAGGKTDWRNSCIDHLEKVEKSCRKKSVATVVIEDNIKGLTAALKNLLKKEPSSIIKGYGETTKKIIELAKLKKKGKRIPSTPQPPVQYSAQGYTTSPPHPVKYSAQGYTSSPIPPVQHSAHGQKHIQRNIEKIILDWVKISLISEKTQTEDENRLQSEIPTTHASFFKSFKGLIDQAKERIAILNGRIIDMQVKSAELLDQKEQLERSLKGTATKSAVDEHQKKAMRDMREQLDKALKEKDHLQLRLSKIAGIQLTHNNPDIVDLSDTNRPTKIGEKYSELYDNAWTDAMENLMEEYKDEKEEEKKEIKSVGVLKDVILKCYKFCKQKSEEQIARIETSLFVCGNKADSTVSPLSKETLQNINDARKGTATQAVKRLQEEFSMGEKTLPSACQAFTNECVELCWYMVIQDPPIILYVGDEKKKSQIDIERFDFYTRSGKLLDFVVWPALRLHAEGPLLRKGVVQPLPAP